MSLINHKSCAMNENKFEYAGNTYVAVDSKLIPCDHCAFWKESCSELKSLGKIPRCCDFARKDRRTVSFVKKAAKKRQMERQEMKTKTEKKILIASWQVCVFDFGKNPFRVVKLGTARRVCIRYEGEIAQCKWHFTTRKKARDFAWRMNEAARRAIGDR